MLKLQTFLSERARVLHKDESGLATSEIILILALLVFPIILFLGNTSEAVSDKIVEQIESLFS